MTPLVKKQLQKCKVAIIPPYDDNTTHLIIEHATAQEAQSCIPNHCYLIELEDYLVNPPPTFAFHINWNGNNIPKSKHYKCECLQLMGKMVKINGVGFDWENQVDLYDMWSGWLPLKSIKIIQEL